MAADDFTQAVHVATDQVPAQSRLGRKRLFQVNASAGLDKGKAGQANGFPGDISPKAVPGQLNRCQANAVHSNTVAQRHIAQIECASFHIESHIAIAGLDGVNFTNGFDNTRKHL
jgi:hypothetical protein